MTINLTLYHLKSKNTLKTRIDFKIYTNFKCIYGIILDI